MKKRHWAHRLTSHLSKSDTAYHIQVKIPVEDDVQEKKYIEAVKNASGDYVKKTLASKDDALSQVYLDIEDSKEAAIQEQPSNGYDRELTVNIYVDTFTAQLANNMAKFLEKKLADKIESYRIIPADEPAVELPQRVKDLIGK